MIKYRTIFAPCARNARTGAKILLHAKISEFAFYGNSCYNRPNDAVKGGQTVERFDKGALLQRFRNALIPPQQSRRQIARNISITVSLLCAAAFFCGITNRMMVGDQPIRLVFVLAVLLTARMTDGLFYGLSASIVSVICVNYVFTYPYFQFNFRLSGYPFTFVVMFTVSIVVSMLTEQVKRQSRAQAEADSEKMKANLLRSVSHDLRTPLTSIIGSSSAILENYDVFTDDVKREMIGHVRDDAQWLMRLVENILSITRVGVGVGDSSVDLRKTPEAVEEIAAEAVTKFRARYKNVQVHVHVPGELLLVPMDATLIEQVCINLMDNAVQHGKTTTRVDLVVMRQDSNAVFIVTDDGQGIDKSVLPKLFKETFMHASERQGDVKRNLGIGLSACMSIVHAHGGDMHAENRIGGGAMVSFSLPLEEE